MVLAVWGPEHLTWAFLPKRDFFQLPEISRDLLRFVPKELWFCFLFNIDSYVVFAAELLNPNPAQDDFQLLNQRQITVTVQSSFTI